MKLVVEPGSKEYSNLKEAVEEALFEAITNRMTFKVKLYSLKYKKGIVVAIIRGSKFNKEGIPV